MTYRRTSILRVALMALGVLALFGGLWAGLLRLGWAGPALQQNLPAAHGPLMVCGFLGTIISLERAVALDRPWAFGVPLLVGVGGLCTLVGIGGVWGPLFVTFGSLGLVAIFGVVLSVQPAPFAIVMTGGAVAWTLGNALWLAGWPVHGLVPWWMGFLVLTIAGERLELSRMLFHAPWVQRLFLGLAGLLGGGLLLTVGWPDFGLRVVGAVLIALAGWLALYDVARRKMYDEGLPRFIAVCLLAGYAWLAVGGTLAVLYGNPGAGPVYDAMLHSVFVGFAFSMIFGHAPVIFPSVLGVSIPYRPVFYVHVVGLHLSLGLRVIGDLGGSMELRNWGGWVNAASILFFLAVTVYSILTASDDDNSGSRGDLATTEGTDPPSDLELDLSKESDLQPTS